MSTAPVSATVFLTQQAALEVAFGEGTTYERQTLFLTSQQVAAARAASGEREVSAHVVRYVGKRNGTIVGYVYFDAHRVRTLPETLMIVVTPAGTIEKIEILAFSEPKDYLPKRRWLDQMHGKRLDSELALTRAIRPISGATLSGRAVVNASRKILAIHSSAPGGETTRGVAAAR